MNKLVFTCLMMCIIPVTLFPQYQKLDMMPLPHSYAFQNSPFVLSSGSSLSLTGKYDARLESYAQMMIKRIQEKTGISFSYEKNQEHASLVIHSGSVGDVTVFMDESYTLEASAHQIEITANTDIGAIRGLETLYQLIEKSNGPYLVPGISIQDKPRFPWRGLLLDVSRHFFKKETVFRLLDAMAVVKLNVLHLHLTDDQGFRIESKSFPKLHELGSNGQYYTQKDIKEIIAYAKGRGIRIVPEFDMPGHATSWFAGYPELASDSASYSIEQKFGIFDPVFNPVNEDTYKFLDKFYKEMSHIFPDAYLHTGGDENNGKHWDKNPEIQQFKKEKNIDLQACFTENVYKIITRYDKKMIGWDEIYFPGLEKDVIIQSWRGRTKLYEFAQKGYQTILSHGYYLDLFQPAAYHYQNDPLPEGTDLTEEEAKNILGGEAAVWSELIDETNLDLRVWPRAAVIAERLWSPGNTNNVENMYERLPVISQTLTDAGALHDSMQEKKLREMIPEEGYPALKQLVELIEPEKNYRRHNSREYTQSTPLNRLVDATRSESVEAREFKQWVLAFTKGPNEKSAEKIRGKLNNWNGIHEKVSPYVTTNPSLEEIKPLSEALHQCTQIGMEALEIIMHPDDFSQPWFQENQKKLGNIIKPYAETELKILPSIKILLDYSIWRFMEKSKNDTNEQTL